MRKITWKRMKAKNIEKKTKEKVNERRWHKNKPSKPFNACKLWIFSLFSLSWASKTHNIVSVLVVWMDWMCEIFSHRHIVHHKIWLQLCVWMSFMFGDCQFRMDSLLFCDGFFSIFWSFSIHLICTFTTASIPFAMCHVFYVGTHTLYRNYLWPRHSQWIEFIHIQHQ